MHDLRQRHCPIIRPTAALLDVASVGGFAFLEALWMEVQKIITKNKIYREVKLLACDLMWKICGLFLLFCE